MRVSSEEKRAAVPYNLLAVLGPTASGKTRLAVQLAEKLGSEIISADSRQVYRGLDIGAGKDLAEYGETPYHLIDIVDPGYEFSVFDFQRHFYECFAEIHNRNRLPIMAGGSALYVDAVLSSYELEPVPLDHAFRQSIAATSDKELAAQLLALKPALHNTTDLVERERIIRALEIARYQPQPRSDKPMIHPFILAIRWDRPQLRQRITERLKQRLTDGLIDEVAELQRNGLPWETLHFYGLEYRYVALYLQGQINNKNDLFQKLNAAIHQFAKKQDTWLRRLERKGHPIHWIDGGTATLELALAALESSHLANP